MTTKNQQMTDDMLVALIDDKISKGIGSESGELTEKRLDAFDYYMGEPYGDERNGRSKVVTREVLETVEWAMPSFSNIFLSNSAPVEFLPVGQDDEEQAEHETRVIQDYLKRQSFVDLHAFIKDALMHPNGYAKVYADEEEEVSTERWNGLTAPQLAELLEDEELEPVGQQEYTVTLDDGAVIPVYDVEVKRTRKRPEFRIEACPPEEVIVDDSHAHLDLDRAPFVCHRTEKSATDLIEMGFDPDIVDELGGEDGPDHSEERVNRREDEDAWQEGDDDGEVDRSMRKLWYEEAYMLVDYDQDGRAEHRCIKKVGNTILENDELDYQPMVSMASILLSHRHTGLPLAELAMIWQRISSVLMRQLLDNSYRVNNPRPVVGPGVDLDTLLSDIPNAPIAADDISQLRMEPTQPIINHLLPTMQLVDARRESTTGVSRNQQGLDGETLAQATKGSFLGAMEAASKRIEMIARVFAETGFRKIYQKMHYLMRSHQDIPTQTKIAGKWLDINPKEWRERTNVGVSVGTGSSTQEQKLLAANAILQLQEKLVSAGGMGVLISPQNIFNSAEELVEASGRNNAERYFLNPQNNPQPKKPPEPSAEEKLIQMQAQIEQMNAELKASKQAQDYELKRRDLDRKEAELLHDMEKEKTELELQYATQVPGGWPHA